MIRPANMRLTQRRLLRTLLIALAVLGSAALVEARMEARDAERLTSGNTFAKVAAGRARYRLLGSARTGRPVVFLNGMVGTLEQWQYVQTRVAELVPSFAYDRGGRGFNSGGAAHDAEEQADELAALLDAVGLRGPVVVVGYSTSASVARMFVARHKYRAERALPRHVLASFEQEKLKRRITSR